VIDPEARALFEFDNFGIADRTELTAPDPYANAHPISVRELAGYIDEHVRLDLAAPVDADLFPEAAIAQEQAERVVSITLASYVDPVDEAAGVLGSDDWKRLNGLPCERSVLGVIVLGQDRGTTFRVCVDRACDIHWPPERASKTRRTVDARPTEAEEGTAIGSATEQEPTAVDRRRQEEAERGRYQRLAPALRRAFLQRVKAMKEPALVAFVIRMAST
jgi:hypothetical protein